MKKRVTTLLAAIALTVACATIGGSLLGAGIGAIGQVLGEVFVGDEKQRQISLAAERRGAYSQPVIWGSDILRAMGVENRVVRAVTGFVGDIMLDPLTYLSGGGNVVRLTATNNAEYPTTQRPVRRPSESTDDSIRYPPRE